MGILFKVSIKVIVIVLMYGAETEGGVTEECARVSCDLTKDGSNLVNCPKELSSIKTYSFPVSRGSPTCSGNDGPLWTIGTRRFIYGFFCVIVQKDLEQVKVLACTEPDQHDHENVPRCCPPGSKINKNLDGCSVSKYVLESAPWLEKGIFENSWETANEIIPVMDDPMKVRTEKLSRKKRGRSSLKEFIHGKLPLWLTLEAEDCEVNSLENNEDIRFIVNDEGEVLIGFKFWISPVWLRASNPLCVEPGENGLIQYQNASDTKFSRHQYEILLYCGVENYLNYKIQRSIFGLLCITVGFMMLFLAVAFLSVWEKLHITGKQQFYVSLCVAIVLLFEGFRTLAYINSLSVESSISCVLIAATAQYFFFALTTNWTVLCFHIFWTNWKVKSEHRVNQEYPHLWKIYILLSWFLPFVIIVILFSIKYNAAMTEKAVFEGVYALATRRCSSPVREIGFKVQGIMFLINIIPFTYIAFIVSRNKQKSLPIRGGILLIFKLVIITGMASLTIPIHFLLGIKNPLSFWSLLFRTVHFIPPISAFFIIFFSHMLQKKLKKKYPQFFFGEAGTSQALNPKPEYEQETST